MYGHLKVETAQMVNEELNPIREKIDELMADKTELEGFLKKVRRRQEKGFCHN